MQNVYYRGQGRAFASVRDVNGNATVLDWLGNAPGISFSMATEKQSHKESYSGDSLEDLVIQGDKTATGALTLENWNLEALAYGLYGDAGAVSGSSVVDEPLPAGLVAGDMVSTAFPKISAVTVKDSAGSPVTLVADTDYRIVDANTGRIEIIDPAGFTQPFEVSYTYAAHKNMGMFTEPAPERYLRLELINTAQDDRRRLIVEFYRVQFDPIQDLQFISTEVAPFTLNFTALVDDDKPEDAALGRYGRVIDCT